MLAVAAHVHARPGSRTTSSCSSRRQAGAKASIDLSWTFDKQLGNYISIYGTAATLHVGWKEAPHHRKGAAGWETIGTGYDKVAAFGGNLDNFLAACDGSAPAS